LGVNIGIWYGPCSVYIANRVNAAFRAEVYNCLLEGLASLEDIDKAIKICPFELGDFVGLEIGLSVFKTFYEGYNDPKTGPYS
jgi:3-hydroxyacyl-CoA dehydrogenase